MNRGSKIDWRTQYDLEDEIAHGDFTATEFNDPSLTQQQFKQDADLNVIVKRFGITKAHIPAPGATDPRYYGDFSDAFDLSEALHRTRTAQEHFESLPAELRNRFANDPVRLLDFVMDPENKDEAVKLGLLKNVPRRPENVPRGPEPVTNNVTPEAS